MVGAITPEEMIAMQKAYNKERKAMANMTEIFDLLEPEATSTDVDTLKQTGMAELAALSSAISLKRIADALTSDEPLPTLMAPVNAYGENFAVAIQEGIVRGNLGISQHG